MADQADPQGAVELTAAVAADMEGKLLEGGNHPVKSQPPDEGGPRAADGTPESSPAPDGDSESSTETPGEPKPPGLKLDAQRRFHALNARAKAAEEERDRLRRELEAARAEAQDADSLVRKALTEDKRPEDFESWDELRQARWEGAQAAREEVRSKLGDDALQRLTRMANISELQMDLEGYQLSSAQLSAIADVRDETPGLSPDEAVYVASLRSPDLFASPEQGQQTPEEQMPAGYQVSEPTSVGRHEAPADFEQQNAVLDGDYSRTDKMMALKDIIAANLPLE